MISRRGIYHDIKDSTYTVNINDMTFYFTSLNTKYRFIKKRDQYGDILSTLELYEQTEKRGFLVEYKGVEHTCPETVLSAYARKI